MQYIVTFLEGIITFISPCLLPLLPVYITFFAGDPEKAKAEGGSAKGAAVIRALGFILGFTVIFIVLGAAFATVGKFLNRWKTIVNIVSGLIVIFFALMYMGVIKWNPFLKVKGPSTEKLKGRNLGKFVEAFIFGLVFSISWTPCVGTFLGSALLLASQSGSTFTGILMLLAYSAGLGIPFMICAVLIDSIFGAVNWIKKHYKVINMICGIFLLAVGVLMATGLLGKWISLLS
ncbi:MAG: cytochrome c biogenesis protein CcdA [Lachnospiraceae bacterium]|nr:cytochrome c biogenesis protein CcdA [Lachnospiraceae bacterium]